MPVLALAGLSYAHPDATPVFSNLTFSLPAGRTGLVGPNGCGKTTLLSVIAGNLPPSGGTVTCDGSVAVFQQTPLPEWTLATLFDRRAAFEVLRRAESGTASIAELEEVDWSLEARFEGALTQVGLPGLLPESTLGQLSGGQRVRAALAAALFDDPGILLMDEPTNNLDREGRNLVFEALARFRGSALIASHDRELLGNMDRILSLEHDGAVLHSGGWTEFEAARSAAQDQARSRLDQANRSVTLVEKRLAEAARRKASRTRSGMESRRSGSQSKLLLDAAKQRSENAAAGAAALAQKKRNEALQEQALARAAVPIITPRRLVGHDAAQPSGKVILQVDDLAFRFADDRPLISGVSLAVRGSERVRLAGSNGAGKSTLLRLVSGDLVPRGGRVLCAGSIARLDQHAGILGESGQLYEVFERTHPQMDQNTIHAALARMGFRGAAGSKDVSMLSGGERVQAALALVLAGPTPPALLVLDEPTNHLDIQAVEAVEAGLATYRGAILVVSHDAVFLKAIGIDREITIQ